MNRNFALLRFAKKASPTIHTATWSKSNCRKTLWSLHFASLQFRMKKCRGDYSKQEVKRLEECSLEEPPRPLCSISRKQHQINSMRGVGVESEAVVLLKVYHLVQSLLILRGLHTRPSQPPRLTVGDLFLLFPIGDHLFMLKSLEINCFGDNNRPLPQKHLKKRFISISDEVIMTN